MAVQGVTIVTGGGSGIGEALARRFAAGGSRVVVADRDAPGAERVARSLPGAIAMGVDVGVEAEVAALVAAVEALGPLECYCSNAGIPTGPGLGDDAVWSAGWAVHVMAHVYAARAVLPGMARRGGGAMVLTASAAGLLTMMGSAAYTVTKHGTVALAEWLSIKWVDKGIHIACLCPQGVRTPLLYSDAVASKEVEAAGNVLDPAEVADRVAEALERRQFLVLPHPEVHRYEMARTADRDKWLATMRRLDHSLRPGPSSP